VCSSDLAADFSKQGGTEVFIAAMPGRYRVINTRGGETLAFDAVVRPGASERVAGAMFGSRVAAAMPARAKGVSQAFDNARRAGFGYGGGLGISASYPVEEDARLAVALSGAYFAQPDLQIFANIRSLPFGGRLSADAGVNFFWEAEDFKAYVGAGPQILYDYRLGPSEKRARYAARAQAGFAAAVGENIDIQAQIPVILSVSGDNSIKSGLEVAFLFWR
jgi:hypothetical protein